MKEKNIKLREKEGVKKLSELRSEPFFFPAPLYHHSNIPMAENDLFCCSTIIINFKTFSGLASSLPAKRACVSGTLQVKACKFGTGLKLYVLRPLIYAFVYAAKRPTDKLQQNGSENQRLNVVVDGESKFETVVKNRRRHDTQSLISNYSKMPSQHLVNKLAEKTSHFLGNTPTKDRKPNATFRSF